MFTDIEVSVYKREFTDEELFTVLGMLNSTIFDYLMRKKTKTHIIHYKLRESQMPRLTEGDDWFKYLSSRAARTHTSNTLS